MAPQDHVSAYQQNLTEAEKAAIIDTVLQFHHIVNILASNVRDATEGIRQEYRDVK